MLDELNKARDDMETRQGVSDSLTRVFEHYLARQLFRRGKLDLAQEAHQGVDTGIDQGDFAS